MGIPCSQSLYDFLEIFSLGVVGLKVALEVGLLSSISTDTFDTS